ncbi:MAG: response regulator [Deltaproteobacteria bacterium]|nr:response regulator [Deltaproteobacteria bacterium]
MANYNIMIIGDAKTARDMMKLSLEHEGYEVENFAAGEAALARLREKEFTVVIIDFKINGIDGMEVLRIVKDLYPAIAVIMITAFANLDVVTEAMREDAHDFFPKPVQMTALKSSISRALP